MSNMPFRLLPGYEMYLPQSNNKRCWVIGRFTGGFSPMPEYWICDEDGKIGIVRYWGNDGEILPTPETWNKILIDHGFEPE